LELRKHRVVVKQQLALQQLALQQLALQQLAQG
jgi:hypothetical protein